MHAEVNAKPPPLGLIAGRGGLPVAVAEAASANGRGVYVLQIAGFEEPRLNLFPGATVGLGELGRQMKLLQAAECEEVVFAGHVARPAFQDLSLDWRGAQALPKVVAAARKGDDALLSALVGLMEEAGFRVIAAEEIARRLAPSAGLLAGPKPSEIERADLAKAAEIAAALGDLDIGQGVVVCHGLVLAAEAQEGTDAMLGRLTDLPPEIRGTPGKRRGVLVKRPKPRQDRRVDLPTIGLETIERAHAAGLAGIGVEAGGALVLDQPAIFDRAVALGLFLLAFDPQDGR